MKITIGSVDYEVVIDEHLSRGNLVGECDYANQVISISPTISNDRRETVFWHEIIHAIFEQIGEEQNEALIDRLSYQIHGVLKSNASFSLFDQVQSQQ